MTSSTIRTIFPGIVRRMSRSRLNHRLALLKSKLPEHPEVSITYFVPDTRKAGCSYVTFSGKVARISPVEQTIVMSAGQTIAIADVVGVEGEMFETLER